MDSPAGMTARAQLDIVRQSVDELSEEARQLRILLVKRTRTFVVCVAVLTIVLSLAIVAATVAVQDNRQQIAENNAKLCPIITLWLPQAGDPPPPTKRSTLFIQRAEKLAADPQYNCMPG